MFHLVRRSAYLLLVYQSCDHVYIHFAYLWYIHTYIYIWWWWCMSSSPISTCVVSFLSLYICFFFVCNLSFLFHTKMSWWVLFKMFQKYKLSKSSCHGLLLQSFSRVCVRIDFTVFNKWVWVEWFLTSLICSFVCCGFVTDCQRERLLGHMWNTLRTYVI